jgi:transposase
MKKNNKKDNGKKMVMAQLAALAEREAGTLVIGIDLGDRSSTYCVRTRDEQIVLEGVVETKATAVVDVFRGLKRQRVVMETGTHSRWMASLLELLGHEVIVGNARKLKLITENNQKSDKVDPRLLSKLACVSVDWLHPVYQRRQETHNDLLLVRSREALVEVRTALVNHARGIVKSFGCRLAKCDTAGFVEVAQAGIPDALRPALSGVLESLDEINEQIYAYDRQIEHLCQTKYQETRWLRQVSGVGPLTALTYLLTIEDAQRFERSRDVGAYLGLAPAKRQSGKRDPQLGITKAGDELVRKLLVNCAHHILGPRGQDSDLRQWGLALVQAGQKAGKKGARKRAAAAVARKLAVLMHRLWVSQQEYDPLRQQKRKAAEKVAA